MGLAASNKFVSRLLKSGKHPGVGSACTRLVLRSPLMFSFCFLPTLRTSQWKHWSLKDTTGVSPIISNTEHTDYRCVMRDDSLVGEMNVAKRQRPSPVLSGRPATPRETAHSTEPPTPIATIIPAGRLRLRIGVRHSSCSGTSSGSSSTSSVVARRNHCRG